MPNPHNDFQPTGLNTDIPIFQKTYDLYKMFYEICVHFPKKDKYTLGQKIENGILKLLESIILASQLAKTEKAPILKQASGKLDIIKVLIRLSNDLKIIDSKKYLNLQSSLQEIGKMLGGWIKASS